MSWNPVTCSWSSPSRATARQRHFARHIARLAHSNPIGLPKSELRTVIRLAEEAHENAPLIGSRLTGRLLP